MGERGWKDQGPPPPCPPRSRSPGAAPPASAGSLAPLPRPPRWRWHRCLPTGALTAHKWSVAQRSAGPHARQRPPPPRPQRPQRPHPVSPLQPPAHARIWLPPSVKQSYTQLQYSAWGGGAGGSRASWRVGSRGACRNLAAGIPAGSAAVRQSSLAPLPGERSWRCCPRGSSLAFLVAAVALLPAPPCCSRCRCRCQAPFPAAGRAGAA